MYFLLVSFLSCMNFFICFSLLCFFSNYRACNVHIHVQNETNRTCPSRRHKTYLAVSTCNDWMNVERAQKPVIAHFVKSAECGSGGGGCCCCLFSHKQPLALVFFFCKNSGCSQLGSENTLSTKNKQTNREKNRARSLQLRMQLG